MKSSYDLIKKPLFTEKSTALKAEENKYVFEVDYNANKIEIKKAVEEMFKVKVLKVNTLRMQGKIKRSGRLQGKTSAWKKAIITLKKGDTIPLFEK